MEKEIQVNNNVKVVSYGQWEIGDNISIDCYVTDDGQ